MNKSSMNKVILIGRLGQNPEQKQLQNGMAICNFSIATTDTRKDASGQYVDNTEWHNIVSFGKQAEFIGQYITKGTMVNVIGKLKTSTWKDNQNITHYKTDIIAEEVIILNKAQQGTNAGNPTQTYQQRTNAQHNQNAPGQMIVKNFNAQPVDGEGEELPF